MLTRADAAAEVMEHLIEHEAHGYSQPNRLGDGTTETLTLSDGETVTIHGGDYDCSEAVRACYAAVGVLPQNSYMWTGNEVDLLTKHGFERVSLSGRKRGDVLLRSGHTEILLSRDTQAGFRRSETLNITGKKGDQDGYESTSSVYDGKWDSCWRYMGPEREEPKPPHIPAPVPDDVPEQAILRMYNPNSGEHFYTANITEAKGLVKAGWDCEGTGWIQPAKGADVYRLYNPNAGDHHYTLNPTERDMLKRLGWRYEGVSFKSGGKVAVLRVYNPNSGRHHHTTSAAEKNALVKIGWRDEGVGWYAEKGV